jgi:hypothetical protein
MRKVYAEKTGIKPKATDAAIERETVVTWSDADTVMHISTSQARVKTLLDKNPSAKLIEVNESTSFFELPVGLFTFRAGKRKAGNTTKRSMPVNAARCGAPTKSGEPCQRIASKKTGKCPRHSS